MERQTKAYASIHARNETEPTVHIYTPEKAGDQPWATIRVEAPHVETVLRDGSNTSTAQVRAPGEATLYLTIPQLDAIVARVEELRAKAAA